MKSKTALGKTIQLLCVLFFFQIINIQARARYMEPNDGNGNAGNFCLFLNPTTISPFSLVCLPPNSLMATNITTTSADLGWTSGGSGETTWDIEWGSTGFSQGSGTMVPGVTSNPYTLSGLCSGVTYDFYVRADCGVGDTSTWAGPHTFTALAITAPYTESFDVSIPSCWEQSATTGGPWVLDGTFTWNTTGCPATPSDHTGNSGRFIAMDYSGTDVGVVIEMPIIDVSALTVPYVQCYHFMCGTGYFPYNYVEIEAYNGSSWSSVATISSNGNPNISAVWRKYYFDISSYVYNTNFVKIRFRAESGGASNDYYGDSALDDISIIEKPCFSPNTLHAGNITTTSADLSWTSGGSGESSWDIEWGPAGFSQGSGTMVPGVTSNPYTLSGLNPITAYDFYVRADCGANTSAWAGPQSFSTICPTYSSFNENIDNVSIPNLPDCWSKLIENGSANSFVGSSTYFPYSAPNSIDMYENASSPNSTLIVISPQLTNLNAGTHRLRFFAINTPPSQDVEVGTMTYPNIASTFTVLETVDITSSYTEYTVDFSGYSGSNTYLAIRRMPTGFLGTHVLLDNLIWEPIPCLAPNTLTATNLTTTSADLGWTSGGSGETTWDIEWGPAGFAKGSGTVVPGVTSNPYTLSGLSFNTAYDFYVRADCGGGDMSTWTGPFSFTTLATCIAPNTLTATNLTTTSADLGWTSGGSGESSWDIEWGSTGFPKGSGTTVAGVTSNPYTLSGLSSNTAYDFYVRADCGGGDMSTWTGPFTFTTIATCLPPNNLTATNLTLTSADLGWTSGGSGESSWDIEWGSTGFSQGSGTTITGVTSNPYTLSGLNFGTTYDFYVRADCGGGDVSTWAGPFSFSTTCSTAAAIYVDANASGNNDGTSWANAFTNLQDAIDAQCGTLDIWIAAGTYLPTAPPDGASPDNRDKAFHWANDMKIYGGFNGTETTLNQRNAATNVTILSGDFNNDDVVTGMGSTLSFSGNSENAFHVFVTANLTSAAVIDGFTIRGGNADSSGTMTYSGQTLYRDQGAGGQLSASNVTVSNCIFMENNSGNGGAIYNHNASPGYTNCLFIKNKATYGGGMHGFNSPATITNCTFSGNNAPNGSAINNNTSSHTIANTIFWDNASGVSIRNDNSTPTFKNSLVEGSGGSSSWNSSFGTDNGNNIDVDPSFVDVANDDFRLNSGSPALDVGDNNSVPSGITTDLANNARIQNTTVDLGAYEGEVLPSCLAPNTLTATNLTPTSADLGWTSGGSGESSWDIEWGPSGFPQGSGTTVAGVTSNPYTLSGLSSNTAYDFYVRADCGGGDMSTWTGPFTFTTLATCLPPNTLTATNLTPTSADLGWTSGGSGETTWDIEWGSTGFSQGSGTTITGVTSNPYTLSGLNFGTTYDFYVRADCGGGDVSTWTGPFSFSTTCSTAAAIYVDANASGNNDGTSWANAFTNLQDAMDSQCGTLDIWIAAGTYLPTAPPDGASPDNRDKAFHWANDMKIYGGFAGTETALNQRNAATNVTILSADFNNDDVVTGMGSTLSFSGNTENAFHVFVTANLTSAAVIDGFTIRGGNADGSGTMTYSGQTLYRDQGAGSQLSASNVTVSNCIFMENN
ncbi:MAG TPA: hypothetical protein ENJ95_10425 [Bacteroidetes bacterium]|nr:hypothetical protein [Bacteroidota bacterium]